MTKIMRGAVMGGIGQGAEKASQQILNAFMMKKQLDLHKQQLDSQKAMQESTMRRNDAYTNYLNNQDILKQAMEGHNEVPAYLAKMQSAKAVNGPGSTANQLATRAAPMPGSNAAEIAAPQLTEAGSPPSFGAGLPRGMAVAQSQPAPDRSASRPPAIPSPAMPPIPPSDPRALIGPQPQFDMPMYGDNDAT